MGPQNTLTIALCEPEIPPNTGNIIRLCANTGTRLELIKPLGFELEDKRMRRAGLDYHEYASVGVHEDLNAFFASHVNHRIFLVETYGNVHYTQVNYQPGDILLFGSETKGIQSQRIQGLPIEQVLCIPMVPGSRSLNLSNSAAIVLYEAWRQLDFSL